MDKKQNQNTQIEGPFTEVVYSIEYDEEAKRDNLHIQFFNGTVLVKELIISTRVSPLDGAVLMYDKVI